MVRPVKAISRSLTAHKKRRPIDPMYTQEYVPVDQTALLEEAADLLRGLLDPPFPYPPMSAS